MLRYALLLILTVCVGWAAYLLLFQKSNTDERLRRIREMSLLPTAEEEPGKTPGKHRERAARSPFVPEKVKKAILSAGVMLRVEEFMLIWVSVTFVPALLVFIVTGQTLLSFGVALVCSFLPILYLNSKKKKRREAFGVQLGDALQLIANGLRAGFSFEQVLETVAREMPAPICQEFARVNRELKMGVTVENSFNALTERMESTDMRLLTSALLIQRQVGGNLAEILDTICITIQDRIRIKNSVKTMTGQGRISGLVVGALPIILLIMVSIMNPEYMSMFFETTLGKVMLGVALGMESIGFLVISKMIKIEA